MHGRYDCSQLDARSKLRQGRARRLARHSEPDAQDAHATAGRQRTAEDAHATAEQQLGTAEAATERTQGEWQSSQPAAGERAQHGERAAAVSHRDGECAAAGLGQAQDTARHTEEGPAAVGARAGACAFTLSTGGLPLGPPRWSGAFQDPVSLSEGQEAPSQSR